MAELVWCIGRLLKPVDNGVVVFGIVVVGLHVAFLSYEFVDVV